MALSGGKFQWKRLENLITLAKEGTGGASLDLNDTVKDAVRLLLLDSKMRRQIVEAFTEDDRLHFEELNSLLEVIASAIVGLKGLWIKVGQFLSSRPDIMPFPYIVHFKKLQDSLPFHPWSEVEQTLMESFGNDYRHHYFNDIAEEPMSSASIAQVHKATLKNGQDVVIKARHRNVEKLMYSDLKNLKTLCDWIAWINEEYDFRKIVEEWIPAVKDELDLRNEAQHLDEVRSNMAKAHVNVIIPKIPDPKLVTSDVIVMEYCDGFSVREMSSFEERGVDKLTLLERICRSFAVQMHVDGVFNADPHPGNILISTDPKQNAGDPSVPILLDFGLVRRFNDDIKIAFSRLIHACYVMDVDGLLRSFEDMGLKIREQDPFQDIVNLRRAFQTIPASEAKAERERRKKEYKEKEQDHPKVKRPIDAWPGELVFFLRVIGLLKGLCSSMEVRYPYLKLTAEVALDTIKNAISTNEHASSLFHPTSCVRQEAARDVTSRNGVLKESIETVLKGIDEKKELVGMQVAAMHKGAYIVDISAGTLSMSDPRPVEPSTLFSVFSVTKGLTTVLLHMAIQRTGASYDDAVSKYWPAFASNGKESCTLRHVLNHQAGLANALPDIATIDEILDWTNMVRFLQEATPEHPPGEKEAYHYLTYGYIVGGILEGMTGSHISQLMKEWIAEPLGITDELFLGLPTDIPERRLAILHNGFIIESEDGMLQSFKSDNRSSNGRPRWERFKGAEHLSNPTTFNLRQVRAACIPSANAHLTARAVAKFYNALTASGGSQLCDMTPVMEALAVPKVDKEKENDVYLPFGQGSTVMGFRVYEFKRRTDDAIVHGVGFPGLGGSIGFVIPEENFSIAITKSHLSNDHASIYAILGPMLEFLDLEPILGSK